MNLQSDAKSIIILLHKWFTANRLTLSIGKTCYSLFGASDSGKSNFCLSTDNAVLDRLTVLNILKYGTY